MKNEKIHQLLHYNDRKEQTASDKILNIKKKHTFEFDSVQGLETFFCFLAFHIWFLFLFFGDKRRNISRMREIIKQRRKGTLLQQTQNHKKQKGEKEKEN